MSAEEILQRLSQTLGVPPDKLESTIKDLVSENTSFKETISQYEEQLDGIRAQLNLQLKENFDIRKALNRAQLASEPAIVQVKQLLLDPAMNKEFSSLKAELEHCQAEIRRLQGELDGLTFTQQSKAGRMLMAKCRKLQEENEEMGREISEGHMHELQTQLRAAKSYAEEMRKKFKELEAHCCALDEEAEDIQQEICHLKSQQEERSGSRYRDRSATPRRSSPEYREHPELLERRRISESMERKRRPSDEHQGQSVRDRSTVSGHEEERDMSYIRRRHK